MTKTAKHSFLFRVWIHIRGLIAVFIVLLGILVGTISLILPNQELYKPYLVNFLSKQWDKEIEINDIFGKWQGFGPKFTITGLIIRDSEEISIDHATLNINVLKYLVPGGSTGIDLGIDDVEVELEQNRSGKIVITDKSADQISYSKKLDEILNSATLSINNLSLDFQDAHKNHNRIKSNIIVQQNQNERAFELQLNSGELADNFTIKSIASQPHDFSNQAKWYIETKNLSLKNLGKMLDKKYLPAALVNSRTWFSTAEGNIIELIAEAELTDSLFSSPFSEKAEILADAELVYKGTYDDWNARLTLTNIETLSIKQEQIIISLRRHKNTLFLKADTLDIPLLKAIAQIINIPLDVLEPYTIQGKLSDVEITYDMSRRRITDSEIYFENMNLNSPVASITGISGELSLHDEQIRILLDSEDGTAVLPGIIRGKAEWNNLIVTAATSMHDDDLDIKVNSVWCDCKDFMLDGSARAIYDKQWFLDLTFAVTDAKTNQLYKYWPSVKWKPKLLNYLDTALISGVVDHGMILYHGWAKQYPFSQNQGIFQTHSSLKNASIKYQKDWPQANQFNAKVSTENRKLWVDVESAQVMKSRIHNAKATIDNLKNPLLKVNISASGMDNFLLELLNQSPMQKGLNILKQDIQFQGRQQLDVNLSVELKNPESKAVPEGRLQFTNSGFKMGKFQINKLNGFMNFKGPAITMKDLKAEYLDTETLISGSVVNTPGNTSEVNINMTGDFPVSRFNQLTGKELPARGTSRWNFNISNAADNKKDILFTGISDLTGTEITLPMPLSKSTSATSPFSISCILPCENSDWKLKLADIVSSQFIINSDTGEMNLQEMVFGKGNEKFGGNIDTLDLDKWIDVLVKNRKNSDSTHSPPVQNIQLEINNLIFMNRSMKNVLIDMKQIKDGLLFEVNGPDVSGRVTLPEDIENRGIIIQLEKLHWLALNEETNNTATSSNISESYPALHIWIGDFVYNGIPLGESSIEVRPVIEGIRVEKFTTQSELMSLNINGLWQRNQGTNGTSRFNIILTSKDIANFLAELGFTAPIKGANTIIDMQASWNDFPSRFEIKDINGEMRIEVGKGEVVDAKPGVGRILGLFSLTNLPRRLILDFKDVFGKGLYFQSMQGNFKLVNGDAYTDEFKIDASGAKIVVKGRTGLAQQDYDQTIIVTPGVSKILPTIGAITGGAVGAAAGFLVQGMFGKGLKNVTRIVYKVTGSWDNPKIELIQAQEKNNEK